MRNDLRVECSEFIVESGLGCELVELTATVAQGTL